MVRGNPYCYRAKASDGWEKLPVSSTLCYRDSNESLGVPLPKGAVRAYGKPHTQEASNLASWQVQIPAEGAITLTWRVQARQ